MSRIPVAAFTPHQRGSNQAFYFHNGWIGARPVWLAARFGTAGILRSLLEHGADPRFVHRSEYFAGSDGALTSGIFAARQLEITTTLMAAVGMANAGRPWVYQHVCTPEHEQATLEKVQLLVDTDVDLAMETPQGLTALDQARALKYESVVDALVAAGTPGGSGSGRSGVRFPEPETAGGLRIAAVRTGSPSASPRARDKRGWARTTTGRWARHMRFFSSPSSRSLAFSGSSA